MEAVLLHFVAGATVHNQTGIVQRERGVLEIEVAPRHRGVLVAVDAHSDTVVVELGGATAAL